MGGYELVHNVAISEEVFLPIANTGEGLVARVTGKSWFLGGLQWGLMGNSRGAHGESKLNT